MEVVNQIQTDEQICEAEQKQMEEVARSLITAMKGIGSDEARIIRDILGYTNKRRQIIKKKYLLITGKELEEDLSSELSGDFLKTVLSLLKPVVEYEAEILNEAIEGFGTDEKKCIEILCTKDAKEIKELKAAYKKIFKKDLEDDLKEESSGDLRKIFRSLASGGRAENHGYEIELVKKEAQNLYDAGQGKAGTDESEFVRILCSRSFAQLAAIFENYTNYCKTDILEAIKNELSGNFRLACMTITKCVRNKPAYFAERLFESMDGVGTNEKDLIQILVRRHEIDLPAIKSEYKRLYQKRLQDVVYSETSGDFRKILMGLIGN